MVIYRPLIARSVKARPAANYFRRDLQQRKVEEEECYRLSMSSTLVVAHGLWLPSWPSVMEKGRLLEGKRPHIVCKQARKVLALHLLLVSIASQTIATLRKAV
jgi:hypothetical protein